MSDAVDLPYDRDVPSEVLVYHYRKDSATCGCGWGVLGASHAEHVADVVEESLAARRPAAGDTVGARRAVLLTTPQARALVGAATDAESVHEDEVEEGRWGREKAVLDRAVTALVAAFPRGSLAP